MASGSAAIVRTQSPACFQGPEFTRRPRYEPVKTNRNSSFFGVKRRILTMQKTLVFYLLYIPCKSKSAQYHFSNFIFRYVPLNAHWGAINIAGNRWPVQRVYNELVIDLRLFKKTDATSNSTHRKNFRTIPIASFYSNSKTPILYADLK